MVGSKQRCNFSRFFAEVSWALDTLYTPPTSHHLFFKRLVLETGGERYQVTTRGQQMISSLALFLFHGASIEARNKNLMRMGGMGPGFHFPVQLSGAHFPGILVSTAYRWSVASPGCGSRAQACGMRRPAGIRPSLLSRSVFISEESTITALHLVKK